MDTRSKEQRSWNMSHIKSQDTLPELIVRSLLHRNGYRFRLHVKELPGKPDIVLPKYRTVIEVRGCFWHYHQNCPNAKIPETRHNWWQKKIQRNVQRDNVTVKALITAGWRVFVIWGCLLKSISKAKKECLFSFLLSSFQQFCASNNNYCEIGSETFTNFLVEDK
ncbi:MAG: hypothetical protein A2017_07070 [Lentisphaerae bacterium GWF2_44_16]|nr:MAG: hypothetical protein A2017_07070 [Lentisphaerae bacterium GWF2_44_16]